MHGLLPNPHISTNPCGFGPPEPSSGNSFLLLRLVRRHAAVRPQVTFRLLCMAGPATVRPCVLFESIRLRPFASGVLIRSMATRIDDPVLQTTTHVRPKSSTRAEVYHRPIARRPRDRIRRSRNVRDRDLRGAHPRPRSLLHAVDCCGIPQQQSTSGASGAAYGRRVRRTSTRALCVIRPDVAANRRPD